MKKIIFFNLIIITTVIFFLEIISNFFKFSNLKGIESGLIITSDNEHKMKPNRSGIIFGQKIFTDKYGFRVPSQNFEYEENNKSVLIIGDSTTFGNGIAENQTFIGKLRTNYTYLNIYNSAVPGHNIRHFQKNINIVDNFDKIDKVFYFVTLNDIYGGESIDDLSKKNKKTYNHEDISLKKFKIFSKLNAYLNSKSYLYLFFKGIATDPSSRYFMSIKKTYEKSDLVNVKNYITSLDEKMKKGKIQLKIFILPYEFQTRSCSSDNLIPQKKITKILKDLNLKYYDFTQFFCKYPKPKDLFLKYDPMHLSEIGHELIFNLVKNEI